MNMIIKPAHRKAASVRDSVSGDDEGGAAAFLFRSPPLCGESRQVPAATSHGEAESIRAASPAEAGPKPSDRPHPRRLFAVAFASCI